MGILLVAIIVVGLRDPSLNVEVYYYTAAEDHYYENPNNWTPSYPGKKIQRHQKIVIQGTTYANYKPIRVRGKIEISPGASLFAFSENVIIETQGSVFNRGEIIVNEIENFGILKNEIAGSIDVLHYHAYEGSETHNLHTSRVTVAGSLMNQGDIFNYSDFQIHKQLTNYANFHHGSTGKLMVNGKLIDRINAESRYTHFTENLPQVLQ